MNALDRAVRGRRDPSIASAASWSVESEVFPDGTRRPIATVFLVNGACPLACVYCGLYRGMRELPAEGSEIASQIEIARRSLPAISGLKLYNASSIFEPASVRQRVEDLDAIAAAVADLDFVVVEARAEQAERAADLVARLPGRLEVAIGLEVADDALLAKLNKPTTVARYRAAAASLCRIGASLRTFVLVAPPFVPSDRVLDLAEETFALAADCGSRVVSLLPTVATHAPMNRLAEASYFAPISLEDFFNVVRRSIGRGPIVVAETSWLSALPGCPACRWDREESLRNFNRTGRLLEVDCQEHVPPRNGRRVEPADSEEIARALAIPTGGS